MMRERRNKRNKVGRYGRAVVASSVLAGLLAVVGSISPASPATVSNYTGNGISNPIGIAVGPDGTLWFTNFSNDSIGRITTSGMVTNYTGPGTIEP